MKLNSSSVDPVQSNGFLHKICGRNYVRQRKEFKCFSDFQDPQKPIPTRKLYPNYKLYPFLKHILSMFHFAWFLGCALIVYEKMINIQGIHVDKIIIS